MEHEHDVRRGAVAEQAGARDVKAPLPNANDANAGGSSEREHSGEAQSEPEPTRKDDKPPLYLHIIRSPSTSETAEEFDARLGTRLADSKRRVAEGRGVDLAEDGWKQVGIAESREMEGRRDGRESERDRLWQGGGRRNIPGGLRRAAGGEGGGREGGEEGGGEAQGDDGEGGGGGGRDGDGGSDDGSQNGDDVDIAGDAAEEPPGEELPPYMSDTPHDTSQSGASYEDLVKKEKDEIDASVRLYGRRDMRTLHTMGDIACMWYMHCYPDQAERLHRKALDTITYVLGPLHHETIAATESLAEFLLARGRPVEAEPLQSQICEWHERTAPAQHDTLIKMATLASIWSRLGRHQDAVTLRSKILEQRKHLPLDGRWTFLAIRDAAQRYDGLKQFDQSLNFWRQSVDIAEELYGPEQQVTVQARISLANCYVLCQEHDEARKLMLSTSTAGGRMVILDAMYRQCRLEGHEKERVRLSLDKLNLNSTAQGPSKEALKSFKEAVSGSLIWNDDCLGSSRETEQLLKEVIDVWTVDADSYAFTVPNLIYRRATILNDLGAHMEAKELWTQVLELAPKAWGEKSWKTRDARERLAYTCAKLGQV